MPATKAINDWREANRLATEAEKRLAAAYAGFFEGAAPEPPAEDSAEAKRLRAKADELLEAAMHATGARAP